MTNKFYFQNKQTAINSFIIIIILSLSISCSSELTNVPNNSDENIVYNYEVIGEVKRPQIGEKPLNFIMNPNTDIETDLRDLEGNVVMIDFDASWCGPCRIAEPKLNEISNVLINEKFKFISIRVDYRKEEFNKLNTDNKNIINIFENSNNLGLRYHYDINYFPFLMLLDKNGVTQKFISPNSSQLYDEILKLLEE